jgi:chemotaxis protein MotB
MAEEGSERAARHGFRERETVDTGAPAWVVTFGDMMSLLLAFFILLLSFSDVDASKFNEVRGSIRDAFGSAAPHDPAGQAGSGVSAGLATAKLAQRLSLELVPKLQAAGLGRLDVEVFESSRGVVVQFADDRLFVRGTDELRPAARPLIEYVAAEVAVAQADFEVSVEARTTAQAPRASRFADERTLTTAQAIAVAQALRASEGVRSDRVRPVGRGVVGEAGARPRPAVEFVFLTPRVAVR